MSETAVPEFAQAAADLRAHLVPMLANVRVKIGQVSFPAIFTDASSQYFDGLLEDNPPRVVLQADSLPVLARGDELNIGSQYYRIDAITPDGAGLVTLTLRLA